MNALVIAVIAFACMFGGGIAGLLLKRRLPDHHLSPETRDVVRLAAGLIGTLAALVLGLLIASANSSFNARDQEIKQAGADLILLDRALRYYGPETTEIRTLLRQGVARAIELHWPKEGGRGSSREDSEGGLLLERAIELVRNLKPGDDAHRSLQNRALQVGGDLARMHWLLIEQSGSSIPTAFLVFLVFWVTMIFASFGLFAPCNTTVIAALFVCSVSIAGSIFLILEMDAPLHGLVKISGAPMHNVLSHLNQ
ncbi:MAG: hypothetical protein NTW68_15045 [candidate division NC10 bacterium]|nr:hypothetical protein [candidate division NC10 bacterium]